MLGLSSQGNSLKRGSLEFIFESSQARSSSLIIIFFSGLRQRQGTPEATSVPLCPLSLTLVAAGRGEEQHHPPRPPPCAPTSPSSTMKGRFFHFILLQGKDFLRSTISSYVAFIQSTIQSFNRSIVQSFNRSIIQSFNHSFIHSIIQSFNHSIIQSFNHSII